ncbi:hypothetical protein F4560_000794 [Saccharothrix ecbatanensis]|uniref:alpha-L-rhamnosidase n=1 Tax=Saccharothrix ecbatanensis TaxID=1105145 RepID=A0A7W9LYQ3_9PSEU|nr:hypothetical protein [Saccharothrix ecbatanensis]MBB5801026.1 hypothetical protein [Saccharothrix ecbatanensis]
MSAVKGLVWGSDLPATGSFSTSNGMLNQLSSNISWSRRSNFLSIPTGTSSRDERLGWTGDISLFGPTANYLRDTRAFLSHWMADMRNSQYANGDLPAVVPTPQGQFGESGVGWSDAMITVPHAVWRVVVLAQDARVAVRARRSRTCGWSDWLDGPSARRRRGGEPSADVRLQSAAPGYWTWARGWATAP